MYVSLVSFLHVENATCCCTTGLSRRRNLCTSSTAWVVAPRMAVIYQMEYRRVWTMLDRRLQFNAFVASVWHLVNEAVRFGKKVYCWGFELLNISKLESLEQSIFRSLSLASGTRRARVFGCQINHVDEFCRLFWSLISDYFFPVCAALAALYFAPKLMFRITNRWCYVV